MAIFPRSDIFDDNEVAAWSIATLKPQYAGRGRAHGGWHTRETTSTITCDISQLRLHSTSLVIKQLMGSSSRQTLQHTGCWGVSCSEHECISTTGSSKSCTKLAVHTIPEWRGQCKYKQCTCYGLSTAAVQWETNDTCYRLLYTPTNYPILNCSFTPNQSCTPLSLW